MIALSYLPNLLSSLRVVCIPYVLLCPVEYRLILLLFVALTDFLDGYLARRWNAISKFGTLVDPIGDKGVAMAYAYLFWSEGALSIPQVLIFFSREWSLLLFSAFLLVAGKWKQWTIQSFWCGKVATTLQAIIAGVLCLNMFVPAVLFVLLFLFGIAAFPELMVRVYVFTKPKA
jgi:phosphatidylglycerophosphate synthase